MVERIIERQKTTNNLNMRKFYVSIRVWSLKKLRNLLLQIQIGIQRFVWLLEKKIGIKRESCYVPLTPTTDCDKENTYSDALSWALDQNNITNIAITGSYGSGKSSVIQKFLKQNPHFKFIDISLACFNRETKPVNGNKVLTDNIELSILQQISYFVKNKKVKDSRISRIKKMTGLNLSLLSLFYGVGLILVLSLFFRNSGVISELEQYIKKDWFNNKVPEFFYVIIVTYLLVLIFCLMRKLVRYFANTSLARIKLHGGEIELNKSQTPSILNQHLDEILYFFEANKTDIVVIEDLDRYQLVEIFSKLREINHLINKSKQINYKTVFIYAVKDDILKEHNFERTKFFDFIIPVVPVINTSNSVDKLLERLNASSVQGIDDRFIKDISLYICDMRLLNNVVNEFLVYQKMLEPGLNADKMFAMILYKNLMPSDFVEMLQNKGIVCGIFKRREELVINSTHELENEIIQKENELKVLQENFLTNVKELQAIYLMKILELHQGNVQCEVNNERRKFYECMNEESLEELIAGNCNLIIFDANGRIVDRNPIDFSEIEKHVSKISYKDRLKTIQNKSEGKEESLITQINELHKTIKATNQATIAELNLKPTDAIFDTLKSYPPMAYLVSNGFINEDYHRYISFFYPGRLTRNDEDYLKSLKDGSKLGYDHPIDNIGTLVQERIYFKEYSQNEILNFTLVDHLFKAPAKFPLQIESILNLLIRKGEATFPFVEQYLENGQQQANFFNALCMNWAEFWSFLEYDIEISEDKLEKFLVCFIKYLKLETAQNINGSNVFADHIANHTNLAVLLQSNNLNKKAFKIISALDIKFTSVIDSGNQEFLDFVYNHNHYKINHDNLLYFLNRHEPHSHDGLTEPNYTNIREHSDKIMFDYISQNLNDYLKDVYLLHDVLMDEEDVFVELLNNEGVDRKIKSQVINKKVFKVWDVNTIEDISVIDELLQHGLIEADWENMISMYNLKDEKLDEYLVGFLNRKEVYIELSKLPCKLEDESDAILVDEQDNKIDDIIDSETDEEVVEETKNNVVEKLSKALILSKSLSIESYKSLMRSIEKHRSDLDVRNLDNDRCKILVSNNILALSRENLIYLSNDESSYLKIINRNKELFIQSFAKLEIPNEKIELIFTKVSFSPVQEGLILNQFDFSQIVNVQIANKVCEFCVVSNFNTTIEMIAKVFRYCNIIELKATMVHKYIKRNMPSIEIIIKLMNLLGSDYKKLIPIKDRPKFPNFYANLELIKLLDKIDFISSYSIQKQIIKVVNRQK